jgi:uncharacterized protein YegP (UPF0339 family)
VRQFVAVILDSLSTPCVVERRSGPHSSPASGKEEEVAEKFEVYKDASGRFRWRLKAANGEIVASGEAYSTRSGAKEGVAAVKRLAPTATVEDL